MQQEIYLKVKIHIDENTNVNKVKGKLELYPKFGAITYLETTNEFVIAEITTQYNAIYDKKKVKVWLRSDIALLTSCAVEVIEIKEEAEIYGNEYEILNISSKNYGDDGVGLTSEQIDELI